MLKNNLKKLEGERVEGWIVLYLVMVIYTHSERASERSIDRPTVCTNTCPLILL